MGELLIEPYEISVWEDILTQDGKFKENKLAVIGSNTMEGPNKVYGPVFNKKDNGEKTLTFSLKYKYFDPYNENEEVVNPFAALLINERKVKLNYDGQWYEFVIKDHTESSDEMTWTYTCTDAFVLELSKNGYNIEFSSDLNNNQGTARELAKKTLEDTDWRLGGVDNFRQLVEEPIYLGKLVNPSVVTILNTDTGINESFEADTQVYVFYSYVKNQNGKFVQFIIYDEDRKYTIDDKNVITDTNYRILNELTFKENGFYLGETLVLSIGETENRFQANRLAYGQLTTYDPVMERTVDRYQIGDGGDREVYNYVDYTYTTSSVVTNFITNGDNFNVLEDGTLQGWNPYTDVESEKVNKLELVTWPELGTNKKLADISVLSQIDGFLKVKFSGPRKTIDGKIYNTVYNSGFADNASFIDAVSAGEQFVLRWRAGVGELGQLDNFENLRVVVAKYTQDQPTRFGYYYKHISPNDIIIDFGEASSIQVLNNYVEGGELVTDSEEQNYVIDGVVQTPSTKYIYKSGNEEYVWSGENGTFTEYNNDASLYLPYNYVVGTAKKAVSTKDLKDPENKKKIGIFLYTTDSTVGEDKPVYIQDIQLTRYIPDGSNPPKPVLIGNIPTATSNPVDHFYLKPADGMSADEVDVYNDAEELLKAIGAQEGTLKPLYNENSEKNLSISVSQSNCFNALQTIAETFECWIDLVVEHDESGAIVTDDAGPRKFVYLRNYAGKDNEAGFKYAVNLESIERNINSDEIVTKLIVNQSQSDYVDEGYVSIANAPSNPSGESYILNFDYYYNQGLLDRESTEEAKRNFEDKVKEFNNDLKRKNDELIQLQNAFVKSESKRNTFTELVDAAKEQKSEALAEFEELTGGMTYEEYRQLHNNDLIDNTKVPLDKEVYYFTSGIGEEALEPYYDMTEEEIALNNEGKLGISLTANGGPRDIKTSYAIQNNQIVVSAITDGGYNVTLRLYAIVDEETPEQEEKRENQQLTEEDTLLDVIGEIYTTSATINNYGGLLSNIEQEYWDLKYQIDGYKSYILKIWVDRDEQNRRHVFAELNDYLPKIKFYIGSHECITSVNKKYFDIITDDTSFGFDKLPEGYQAEEIEYTINDSLIKKIKINLASGQSKAGIKEEIDDLIEEKAAYVKDFNNKYSRFIQEGTWNSTDYIDSELYYLDALQVSNTSAQPAVSYTINVVEISQLDGYEWYSFDAGDKTYVEDTEFFGWANKNGVLTPAREEVIVSEVEWHLDAPDQNVITVRNYKTRFEDLFQRISAAVQTVQYNEATYAKISSLMDADGTINQNVLLNSLNRISGKQYNLTSDGSVVIEGDNIIVQNLTNGQNLVKISSKGIEISSDGGGTWKTAIDGEGINIGVVYTGTLNTDKVVIGGDNPSFRWDQSGISAYKSNTETGKYDLQTYVRYDEYGLYGIKNGEHFKAQNLQDVLDKAHFAVTWDGFFIKNSYPGGGRVEITSDNDFRVMNIPEGKTAEQEKIKIGALEWGEGITSPDAAGATAAPTLYGIRIKNDDGAEVMKTDDEGNITITGTINATGGNFSDLVTVGKNTENAPYIAIDGTNASIKSSNYSEGAGYGWMINKDGDAVFNNITARGAIKTAVFEYAEIQAVGGIFIFRPSSTIKEAEISGEDLILTVEKPLLFKVGQWCKISNYANGNDTESGEATNPDVNNILLTNGLTHVYPVANVNGRKVTLTGAKKLLTDTGKTKEELAGGALVDMGNKANGDGEVGTSNYGIGVNSSDNTVNLPRRAISLFETVIDETKNPKVSYNYRGIFGTLPTMSSDKISPIYSAYMEGKQGIYTDNMYIGDKDQYIAFYKDGNGNSQLRLVAKSFEILPDDSDLPIDLGDSIVDQKVQYTLSTSKDINTLEEEWKDTPYEVTSGYYQWQRTYVKYAKGRIDYLPSEDGYYISDEAGQPGPQGPQGPSGEDAVNLIIDSSNGNTFKNNSVSTVLTVTIFKGATIISDITQLKESFGNTAYLQWYWKRMGDNTFSPLSIDDSMLSNGGFTLTLTPDKVDIKVVFQCEIKTVDN